jgi:hypothetical protein
VVNVVDGHPVWGKISQAPDPDVPRGGSLS